MRCLSVIILALVVSGCARFEHAITHPPELAQHIGRREFVTVERDPLEYQLRTVDNRLLLRIHNPTVEPVQFVGDRSFVIDPRGESHPFLSQTIAPGSFIRIVLPPPPPRIRAYGPTFGVGVGARISSAHDPHWRHRHHHGFAHDYWDVPYYITSYGIHEAYYWDWRGETSIDLKLVFRTEQREFVHEFTLRRIRM